MADLNNPFTSDKQYDCIESNNVESKDSSINSLPALINESPDSVLSLI